MGKIEYFKLEEGMFRLGVVSGVCRVRYTNDEGEQTIIDDTNIEKLRKQVLDCFDRGS
jgi:hypothetical protein